MAGNYPSLNKSSNLPAARPAERLLGDSLTYNVHLSNLNDGIVADRRSDNYFQNAT